jgi:uncharacterized small protein (DUF1192 family)
MDYVTLGTEEKIELARGTLFGREADHFRVSLLSEPRRDERLAHLESEIENIKAALGSLEKEKSNEA